MPLAAVGIDPAAALTLRADPDTAVTALKQGIDILLVECGDAGGSRLDPAIGKASTETAAGADPEIAAAVAKQTANRVVTNAVVVGRVIADVFEATARGIEAIYAGASQSEPDALAVGIGRSDSQYAIVAEAVRVIRIMPEAAEAAVGRIEARQTTGASGDP